MKPKVLTFCPLPPTITGGIEEYAYSVIEHMKSKGFDVKVVTSKFNDSGKYLGPREGYIYLPSFSIFKRPVPKNILSLMRIATLIRNSDLIHVHMPYPFLESFSTITSRLFRKPVIVTYHMDAKIDDSSASKRLTWLYSTIEKVYVWLSTRWACCYCDVICTNTMGYAASSKVLKNYLSKIKVIHQGIRKDLYSQLDVSKARELRSRYTDHKYTYMVTFVGRLVPYKGLAYLIEAIYLLKDHHHDILFVIGGCGPEKDRLMDMAESYGLQNIKFIGFVPDEILFNLFAASDVVVSPSISNLESTPISLLCALSTGTPVIGTEVGGTGETISSDGISGSIISTCNPKELSETIINMLDMKRTGKVEKPVLRFWSDVADDYLKLMTTLYKFGSAVTKKDLVGV